MKTDERWERPKHIRPDQAWFWTERWQEMEREADADIEAGRTILVDGLEGLLQIFDHARGQHHEDA